MDIRSSILILPILILGAIASASCGTELSRISFSELGAGKTELTADSSKEIDFWTHLDLVIEEDASLAQSILEERDVSLVYSVEVYQSNERIHRVDCDPFDISSFDFGTRFKNIKTSIRTTRSFQYDGKMRCSVSVPNAGATVVEAVLSSVSQADGSIVEMPESFRLTSADLVIKQR